MSISSGTIRYTLLAIFFIACNWLSPALFAADNPVQVSGGWVRETPPGARNAAAFLTIVNHANTDKKLVGIQCEATLAAHCEIHEHLHSESGMRMQKVTTALNIPGNSSLILAPGGYHVMLLDLPNPLLKGSTIELVLLFDDQSTIHTKLPVKPVTEE